MEGEVTKWASCMLYESPRGTATNVHRCDLKRLAPTTYVWLLIPPATRPGRNRPHVLLCKPFCFCVPYILLPADDVPANTVCLTPGKHEHRRRLIDITRVKNSPSVRQTRSRKTLGQSDGISRSKACLQRRLWRCPALEMLAFCERFCQNESNFCGIKRVQMDVPAGRG